ncbi:MAG TPA: DUF1800 domain-containing protein [Gemmatimonadaceae bacterium]|nr:DUF1800 domain-containing protein [Gemmatimonadaceae bacterium]
MPFSVLQRGFLFAVCVSAAAPVSGQDTRASTAPDDGMREQTADQQVRHVLARLTFGARPGDYERVRATGVDAWIAGQLEPRRIADPEPESLLAGFETLHLPTSELFARFPPPQQVRAARAAAMRRQEGSAADSVRVSAPIEQDMMLLRPGRESQGVLADLQMARVLRAVTSERQLEEVMVDFWLNHFSVFGGKGPERYFLAAYERESIRPYALGQFRELLGAVAKSTAMLFYLDNWQSSVEPERPALAQPRAAVSRGARRRAGSDPRRDSLAARLARVPRGLNENYARELLELHTLGVEGGFTQADVVNVARALTGWSLDQPRERGGFIFRPIMHDAGEKSVLGHRLAPGRGMEDGEQVLDIVAAHPSTARFIATKLARRFVSDEPPAALVERAAATFTRTNGDIRETVRTIVTAPEFFAADAYRAKVKSPFELVVSALRAVNAAPDLTPRTARVIAALGQPLYLHQAPNGYPETGEPWINTGTILNRINFAMAMAAGRVPGVSLRRWPEADRLRDAPRTVQVDGVIHGLLGGEASPDTRRILESGINPMLDLADADTLAADLGLPDENAEAGMPQTGSMVRARGAARMRPTELKGLAQVIGLALGSPEFQRR